MTWNCRKARIYDDLMNSTDKEQTGIIRTAPGGAVVMILVHRHASFKGGSQPVILLTFKYIKII
jgi:predicted SnoaL-like aldol condensation-catalyzing enzyme